MSTVDWISADGKEWEHTRCLFTAPGSGSTGVSRWDKTRALTLQLTGRDDGVRDGERTQRDDGCSSFFCLVREEGMSICIYVYTYVCM